ncbi:1748_t:CDS:2, partial [Gigaspora rosea]
ALAQIDKNKREHVIVYASRSFLKAKQNYSATELKCLAVLRTTKLVGRKTKWIRYLEPYNFTIMHRDGRNTIILTCYQTNKLSEKEFEVNIFDLYTKQKAFEAVLARSPIT